MWDQWESSILSSNQWDLWDSHPKMLGFTQQTMKFSCGGLTGNGDSKNHRSSTEISLSHWSFPRDYTILRVKIRVTQLSPAKHHRGHKGPLLFCRQRGSRCQL